MSIRRYCDLSTLHISQQDSERLSELATELERTGCAGLLTVYEYDLGFVIPVPALDMIDEAKGRADPEVDVSMRFLDLLREMRTLGVDLLNIDRDGDVEDGRFQYEW